MWIILILGFVLLFRTLAKGDVLDIDTPSRIDNAITINAEAYKHDPLLIRAIISTESNWIPDAKGTSGEIGLMQISEICLKHFNQVTGMNYSLWDLYDVHINVMIGCWYLNWLKTQTHGEIEQMLRAYNCGLGNRHKEICGTYYCKVMKAYDELRSTP